MRFVNCPKIDTKRFCPANQMFGVGFSETVNAAKFGGINATYIVAFYRVDDCIYRVSRVKRARIQTSEVRLVWIPSEVAQLEAAERDCRIAAARGTAHV